VTSGGQTVNTHYSIGAANRLMSFATTANPPGGPTPSASYTYDANGNEIGGSRTWGYNARNQATTAPATPSGGTLTQTFLGEGQAERVSEGATTFRYNRLGLSSRTDASGTTYVTRDNDGRVISERSGAGTRRYYTVDGLGSTVSLTDAGGNETSSYSYDPFGNRVAGAGNAEALFQFAGGYRMPSGMYHFGQRYYDPVIGRFTQQDPLDQVADLRQGNRYLYAGQDPVNLIDPSGTSVLDTIDRWSDKVQDAYVEYVRDPLKTRGGSCLLGGAIYGGVAFKLSKDPRITAGAAVVGCGLGLTRKAGF